MARAKKKTQDNAYVETDVASMPAEVDDSIVADGGYQMGTVETADDEESREEQKFKKAALELVTTEGEDSMELVDTLGIELDDSKDDFLDLEDWDPDNIQEDDY